MTNNGMDDNDPYDVPRPDDLYRRCEHGVIANECGTCEYNEPFHCACGNESRYNPQCDECTAKCNQTRD